MPRRDFRPKDKPDKPQGSGSGNGADPGSGSVPGRGRPPSRTSFGQRGSGRDSRPSSRQEHNRSFSDRGRGGARGGRGAGGRGRGDSRGRGAGRGGGRGSFSGSRQSSQSFTKPGSPYQNGTGGFKSQSRYSLPQESAPKPQRQLFKDEDDEDEDDSDHSDHVEIKKESDGSDEEEHETKPKVPATPKQIFKPADPSQLASAPGHPFGKGGLLMPVTPLWSQSSPPKLESAPPPSEKQRRKAKAANVVVSHASLTDEHIASLEERAGKLLERENDTYSRMFEAEATGTANAKTSLAAAGSNISAADARFIRSLLSTSGEGGTLSDRISALTLLLQSSPLHNLRPLESLMAMVRKKNRDESGRASRALADWFASASGLPSDRKLRYFRDQAGLADVAFALSKSDTDKDTLATAERHLLLYAFEHRLKTIFFDFLLLLEARTHDALAFARQSAVIQISNLLSAKAEQEQNLLRLLVNKLGDGERSVASKASNALLQLLTSHPGMKSIVIREVADLVLKPSANVPTAAATKASGSKSESGSKTSSTTAEESKKYNSHARYYGVLTLNQTMITSQDRENGLANALVNLYFELFEGILEEMDAQRGTGPGRKEEKLGAGGEAEDAEDDEEEDEKKPKQKNRWRDQPGKRGKKGKRAAAPGGGKEVNAVVKDAEAKIVAALLTGVRRAMPFARLETAVFERHIDTLFRITHSGTFNISIQALQLIFQVCTSTSKDAGAGAPSVKTEGAFTTSAKLTDRYYRTLYASLIDPRLEETSKQAMYLNLLFRSMKVDCVAAATASAPEAAEDELQRLQAFAKRLVQVLGHHQPPFICGALFMLGELSKLCQPLREMVTVPAELRSQAEVKDEEPSSDDPQDGEVSMNSNGHSKFSKEYDGVKRDPKYAKAGSTCLWELVPLVSHYHPSVALHTRQLIDGVPISANPDLNTSSLSHFLDRFVFRNPKAKAPTAKGASIMQPGEGTGTGGLSAGVGVDEVNVVNLKGRGVSKEEDVMNPKFLKKSRDEIPVDQLFFHQYFQQKQAREQSAGRGPGPEVDEEAEQGDVLNEEEFGEDEIWEAITNALPESGDVDGLEDSDGDDDELFDYEDSDDDLAGVDLGQDSDDEDAEDGEADALLFKTGEVKDEEEDDDDDDDDSLDIELHEDDPADFFNDDSDGVDEDDSEGDEEEDEEEGDEEEEDMSPDEELEDDIISEDDDESQDAELFEDEDDLIPFDEDSDEEDDEDLKPAPSASLSKQKRKRGKDEEEEDEQGAAGGGAKMSNQERRAQRKKRKAMPTFASADDYAHLLASDDEGS
ncbi:RNA-binding ribosome biosynthesis protein mak21 [Tilletia horrida]|uniref:RNA-binding ribosome biosynthesis protein mak21 n=1 Tax=Tilletia horrida TaxID=155126 RepID=A0AAN6JRI8_9BASI|nr:RNA-binding ribosome biosynthesis protein mak21 [Tilletia horrida]KAK0551772.1 RNA-binding ribosome biosynthesis protein mak21 [Tilletia horrida]KAK0568503.1 RNA-binding ribosome biosynthesis protein mak21 [Tilletia horrida]